MKTTSIQERFRSISGLRMEDELILRTGAYADYQRLRSHHYCAGRPATMLRVLVLEHAQPGVVGRYLGRRQERQVAAVLVESLPSLSWIRCFLNQPETCRSADGVHHEPGGTSSHSVVSG